MAKVFCRRSSMMDVVDGMVVTSQPVNDRERLLLETDLTADYLTFDDRWDGFF